MDESTKFSCDSKVMDIETLYSGLKELAEDSFPKTCSSCGRCYTSLDDYLTQTRPLSPERSGLKAAEDDDGDVIVEVYRNCICGSTLMDFCADRRDNTPAGILRRKRFERLISLLGRRGITPQPARQALLAALRGQNSPLLNDVIKRKQPPVG